MRQLFRSGVSSAASYPLEGGVELAAEAAQEGHGASAVALAEPTTAAPGGVRGGSRPQFFTFTRKVLLTLMGFGVISLILGTTMRTTRSSFTATTVNPANAFATGTLTMTNSSNLGACSGVTAAPCGAISITGNAGSMVPGDIVSGTVTITNSGGLPATMTLSTQNAAGPLTPFLTLTIHDDTSGFCVYGQGGSPRASGTGACDATPTPTNDPFDNEASLTLPPSSGTRWAATEFHTYTISVSLAAGAGSGDTGSIDLVWQGQQ